MSAQSLQPPPCLGLLEPGSGCARAEDCSLTGRAALLHRMRTSRASFTRCHGVRGPRAPAGSKCSRLFVEGLG